MAATFLCCGPGLAHADFGVQAFDGQVTAGPAPDPLPDPGNLLNPANFAPPYTQAGGHPFAITTQIRFNRETNSLHGENWPVEPVRDVLVDVPAGLVGNPTVAARCRGDELARPDNKPTCPPASQVGWAIGYFPRCVGPQCPVVADNAVALYSMVPPPDVPARFGFSLAGTIVMLDASVRKVDGVYRAAVDAKMTGQGLPIVGTDIVLWGTPANPEHDFQRSCPGEVVPLGLGGFPFGGPTCSAGVQPKPLLTLPTACTGPLTTTARVASWFHPGVYKTASFESHLPPGLPDPVFNTSEQPLVDPGLWGAPQGVTDCDQVPFTPALTAKPTTPASPGASAWAFDITTPQDALDDPDGIAQGHLKKVVMTLPEGVRVSPSSANGLGACSSAQIALATNNEPSCPNASKVGLLTIDTPILDEPLKGSIYLATPFDNPSSSLIALYFVAKGPGVVLKLAGSASPDPKTGRLSATFDDLPQQPFSHVHAEFFGGPHASISNPARCGTYTTTAVMTSWSGKTATSESSFTTSRDGRGAPCPEPRFKPTLEAGTTTSSGDVPAGGSFSRFDLNLARNDDDEELAAIDKLSLPDGLLARVGSVSLCEPARVAAGTCDERSRIGSVTTTAGPGPDPFAVHGRVYFGGPYKGAPFSLSIVVPAKAGPFDLGTVVVRSALFVDRHEATLRAVTDPLPAILEGIPLQVRVVHVTIDRPSFMVNPTSCDPTRIEVTARSTGGTVADLSDRFQVSNCKSLPLRPRMRIVVGSKGHTAKRASTPLRTVLTQRSGEANLASVAVTLPATLNARLGVVNSACSQAQFDAGQCESAKAGTATAVTPLLKQPLRGGVFFVKDPTKPPGALPNLIVALRGQVDFDLVGTIKIPHGKLLSTHFTRVPDVPIKKFTLSLVSGAKGPLGAVTNLCAPAARRATAHITYRGQNGKLVRDSRRMKIRGCRG